jgi:hypothetical protein
MSPYFLAYSYISFKLTPSSLGYCGCYGLGFLLSWLDAFLSEQKGKLFRLYIEVCVCVFPNNLRRVNGFRVLMRLFMNKM